MIDIDDETADLHDGGATNLKLNQSTASASMPCVLHTRVVTGVGGGPDKTILNSPRFLRPLGYRSLCAYMHPPDDPGFAVLRQRAAEAEAALIGVPDRGPLDWRVVRQLIRLCREQQVAIWHGHDYKSNALGLLARRFWPMKLVTTVHGWGVHGGRRRLYYRIDKLCLRRYDEVVCVSDTLREECLRAGVPQQRCQLIRNAIDTQEFRRQTTREDAKRRLGVPVDRFLLGAVGRLSGEKGFDLLIRAAHRLIREGRDLSLWIAGEGDMRQRLETLIGGFGCGQRIRLLGHMPDPKPFFEAMDAYVLSSIREGLPNVVLEAMAMHVPVLATRVAGVPSVLEDNCTGILMDCGSEDALLAGISRLLDDGMLREKLANAARATIESSFSFDERMCKMAGIYDRILNSHAERPEYQVRESTA